MRAVDTSCSSWLDRTQGQVHAEGIGQQRDDVAFADPVGARKQANPGLHAGAETPARHTRRPGGFGQGVAVLAAQRVKSILGDVGPPVGSRSLDANVDEDRRPSASDRIGGTCTVSRAPSRPPAPPTTTSDHALRAPAVRQVLGPRIGACQTEARSWCPIPTTSADRRTLAISPTCRAATPATSSPGSGPW